MNQDKSRIDPIRMGVVGLNFGSWVIDNEIQNGPGQAYIDLVAVCDLQPEKVSGWYDKPGVKGYTKIEHLLENPQVEAVGLFTGPAGRAELIEQILDAGKDIMTTKPFELDSRKARRVLEKAQRLGRVVHLNSPSPMMPPDIEKIAEWIRNYDLGRPIAYRASTWCSYREKADGSWYDDPALCPAAPIFRLGIYLINDTAWFFQGVRAVKVLQSRVFTERPTADNAQLSILHEDGSIGNIFASFCIDDRQHYRCALELNFERGTIYRNSGPIAADIDNQTFQLEISASVQGRQVIERCLIENNQSGYQWDHFWRVVRRKVLNQQASHEMIVSGIKVIELMAEAGR